LILVLLPVALTTACATQKTAVRNLAERELACPGDAIEISKDEPRVYSASGCGMTVRIACHDPHESTGAQWGWSDPLTAGNRAECEKILDRPQQPVTVTSAPLFAFDRDLAAKLLSSATERAKSCGAPNGPRGKGTARVTFATNGSVSAVEIEAPFENSEEGRCVKRELERVSMPGFSGTPVTVKKAFEIAP